MALYERRQIEVGDDGSFAVEGRVVEVLDAPKGGRRTITVLVEVAESAPAPAAFSDDSEGVDDVPDKATLFCNAMKADDEPCGREVDNPGDTCWQH